MNDVFDYVFYRTFVFYSNRKSNAPQAVGSAIISLIQFFCIVDILFVFQLFLHFEMPSKIYAGILCIFLIGVNWYKYERNPIVDALKAKWGDENDEQKSTKGTLIIVALVILISFPIIIGILK